MINESALALVALRKRARGCTPPQLESALQLSRLPSTMEDVLRRLESPASDEGLRRRRWQHRRCFFLMRARGPEQHVLRRLPVDLFEYVVKLGP